MDDLVAVLGERRHRRFLRIRRARKVDYKELLRPPVEADQRCPHTTQIVDSNACSQCQGVKAKRVSPQVVVPENTLDEE